MAPATSNAFESEYMELTDGTVVTWRAIPAADLTVDPRVQRPEDSKKLKTIIKDFEPLALGQITVSRRTSGANIIIDGQHRWLAAQAVDYGEPLNAKVIAGLTLEQEARLFRLLNNTTKASRMALFQVAVTEGDETALEVVRVLAWYGLRADFGSFAGVAAAVSIINRKDGSAAFDWALDVIQRAFGPEHQNFDSRLVTGLALLRLRESLNIETDVMVKKLALLGMVSAVIGKAKLNQQVNGGRMAAAMCRALVNIYNVSKKPENRLPDWDGK